MMKTLTEQQQRVLSFIQQSVSDRGYPPSVRETADYLGLSSSSTVHQHMRALENKGYITIDPGKPRAVTVVSW